VTAAGAARPSGASRLRRSIVAIGVVSLCAIVVSSAYDVWRSYHRVVADVHREITNAGKALAEQLEGSLQSIDVVLRATADWYATLPRDTRGQVIEEGLAQRAAEIPQIALLTISDDAGTRRYRSRESAAIEFSVADREYFKAHAENAHAGVFLSKPLTTRSDGRVSFVLSRRLNDARGHFAGVVAAIVELSEYQQFYRAINLGTGSAIALFRNDGTLILREPPTAGSSGALYPEMVARAAEFTKAKTRASPFDGVSRIAFVVPIETFPLLVGVARDSADVLAPWRDEAVHVAVRTILIVLLGTLAIVALTRQLARIEHNQRALRESEERYVRAMEGANEGHFDWNLDGGPSFLSPQMKALHGRRATEPVTGRDAWMAGVRIHPDDMEALAAATRDHFTGTTPQFEAEYRVMHPDGTWHWIHARGRCLRDDRGAVRRFAGSAIDITPRKAAEADKSRLEAQLRHAQRLEAMGTLASGIAHDFNNILGAILGYGELAHKATAEGTSLRRYLDNVMNAGVRAKSLVERILAFSRSGMGETALVQVEAVVRESVELLAASLPPGIEVDAELRAGSAAVMGDATQLHQLVMNLGTNAIQATAGGGTVRIALDRVEVAQARVLSHAPLAAGTYARLSVSDTGTGIAPDVVERIFDPFFTTKGVGKGTGLGLSLVHALVLDLHGAIDVRTELGKGTTFEIWLPVAGEVQSAPSGDAGELPRGNGETVLIVDDEAALVALAEEFVAELGYEPVGFTSSIQAIAEFEEEPSRFDVVVTDENMDGINGTELARAVRAVRGDIPIILMTGYADPALRERAAATGIGEVLQKPLRREDLAVAIARTLA
jgi:PAS domain S-box-containing protein